MVAVISVGVGNRFGHPAPQVLERLAAVEAQLWRTDECGPGRSMLRPYGVEWHGGGARCAGRGSLARGG